MRRLGLWSSLLAAAASSVSAQVSVEVTQPQDQFLPGEAIPITVRIINRSGQTLRLGGDADWLKISLESREGFVVPRVADLPVVEPFELPSSKVASKLMDIGPSFSITKAGRYKITAAIQIKQWDREVIGEPKVMEIMQGIAFWEQEFGLPKPPGAPEGSPEIRRYILQQANYIKGQLRLYLRIADVAGARPQRVIPVGRLVSVSRPEHVIDQFSNLHILYQDGAHSFGYFTYNPDGELLARQTYDYVTSRPRLKVDAEGKISVQGGLRRVVSTDVPPPPPPEPALSPEPPKPLKPTDTTAVTKP